LLLSFIWPIGFRREELKKLANQKQESPVVAMFVNGSGRNEQSLQGARSSIDASYQVSVHLTNRFQKRRIKKNQPIRNNNRL
jgi:hypothetical protein